LIDQIVDNYVNAARAQALGKINDEFAQSTIDSVSRDINFSFDQRVSSLFSVLFFYYPLICLVC